MNGQGAIPTGSVPVPDELVKRSMYVSTEVAERLRSPEAVRAIVCRPANVWPSMPRGGRLVGRNPWAPCSLSNGHPGVALLHAVLADNDPSLRKAAHEHLAAAVAEAPSNGSAGLFGAHGSIAFAAAIVTTRSGGYTKLLSALERALAHTALMIIDQQGARVRAGELGVPWEAYDVIVGLAGVGRELLLAIDSGRNECMDPLSRILAFFVTLSEPIDVDGHRVPGWWTPPQRYLSEGDKELFPHGDFNLGLAHGISGPLALLAVTLLHGVEVEGQRDAMRRITDWLLTWLQDGDTGRWWPGRVPWDEQIKPRQARSVQPHTQPSWCYGVPGVARAIQLAGRALADPALERVAVAALLAVLRQPSRAWQFSDANLCHGYGGLLLAAWRIAGECADPELAGQIHRLIAEILARYDPAAPFCFRHLAWGGIPHGSADVERWSALDIAGVMEGAAGIALALLTATGNVSVDDQSAGAWDAALLLS